MLRNRKHKSTHNSRWPFSGLFIIGHGHWHCGSMVPILSNLFPYLLTLHDSKAQIDRVRNAHLSPVLFYFLNIICLFILEGGNWKQLFEWGSSLSFTEILCGLIEILPSIWPPTCFLILYEHWFVGLPLGPQRERTLIGLDLLQFSGTFCGQLLPIVCMSNYPDLPS